MNKEETYSEKRTREISEQANPYDKNCPNRHLWSEGFRTGYIHAKNIVTNLLKEDMKLEAEKGVSDEDRFRFTEWIAKQITIEMLEYNFSDEIWYFQSNITNKEIHQFTTEGLYKLFKAHRDNLIKKG